jgi:hypothetical protein
VSAYLRESLQQPLLPAHIPDASLNLSPSTHLASATFGAQPKPATNLLSISSLQSKGWMLLACAVAKPVPVQIHVVEHSESLPMSVKVHNLT